MEQKQTHIKSLEMKLRILESLDIKFIGKVQKILEDAPTFTISETVL